MAPHVIGIVRRLDRRVFESAGLLDPIPAVMHVGRDIDRVGLVDRRLHLDDGLGLDTVIGAERRPWRAQVPALQRPAALLARPELFLADAVLVEALHGAAAARSFV